MEVQDENKIFGGRSVRRGAVCFLRRFIRCCDGSPKAGSDEKEETG